MSKRLEVIDATLETWGGFLMLCAIVGCEREALARGWCSGHWKRWRKHGDPLAGGPRLLNKEKGLTLEERFWKYVEKTDGCWLWTGTKHPWGYGWIWIGDGRHSTAHRVSWEITHGSIPEGMFVCHTCDNPPCVRPDHLFVGTHTDNMQDMVTKGRHAKQKLAAGQVNRFLSQHQPVVALDAESAQEIVDCETGKSDE